jgi:hypothetical protein
MIFDVKTLSTINLLVQALLLVAVMAAAYLARSRKLIRHCKIMRVAVAVQLLALFSLMLPMMLSHLKHPRQVAFQTEMLIHHSFGVLVVLLWIYINLAVMGRVKLIGRLTTFMRTALVMWVLTFLLGLYLYFQVYVLP